MKINNPMMKSKDDFAERIVYIIARYYGKMPRQILEHDRKQETAEARNFCYHFLRVYTKLTFCEIGVLMNRDHSSVFPGDKKVRGYMDVKDRSIFSKYLEIKYWIDEAIKIKHPRSFPLRISTFAESETLTI